MRISEYPYGRPTKSLKKASIYINRKHVSMFKGLLRQGLELCDLHTAFHDDPECCGLPASIYCRLNTDEVDWLQEGWFDLVEKYLKKHDD